MDSFKKSLIEVLDGGVESGVHAKLLVLFIPRLLMEHALLDHAFQQVLLLVG